MNEAAVSSVATCALCGRELGGRVLGGRELGGRELGGSEPGGSELGADFRRVNGHAICVPCSVQVDRELAAQSPTLATLMPAAALGLLGAFAGALVWTIIAVSTELAIGFVAILVGFLAGTGVKVGAGKARGQGLQILAALLAVVGLAAAKYMIVAYAVVHEAGKNGVDLSYLDPRILTIFGNVAGKLVSPFDLLWIVLAVGAAYKVPASRRVSVQR